MNHQLTLATDIPIQMELIEVRDFLQDEKIIEKKEKKKITNPFHKTLTKFLKMKDFVHGIIEKNYHLSLKVQSHCHKAIEIEKKLKEIRTNTSNQQEIITVSGDEIRQQSKLRNFAGLFYLLVQDPKYLGNLFRYIKSVQAEKILQILLTCLFPNHGDETEEVLLMRVVDIALRNEFEDSTGTDTLLRSNTNITKLLYSYTKREPCQQYIHKILSVPLAQVLTDTDLNISLNPIHIYKELYPEKSGERISDNTAYDDEKVNEIINERTERLLQIFDDLLEFIVEKPENVPLGLRLICQKIRFFVKEYYPECNEETIATFVSAFFFLRYLNPSLVTPTALGIFQDHDPFAKTSSKSNRIKTNLLVVGKFLQTLSNMSTFGKKEKLFLKVPENYIQNARSRLLKFLDKLCDIEDPRPDPELDKYMLLSKSDLEINITLNDIYFVHECLHEHLDKFKTVNKDPIVVAVESLGGVHEQLKRQDNCEITLNLLECLNLSAKIVNPEASEIYTETILLLVTLNEKVFGDKNEEEIEKGDLIETLWDIEVQLEEERDEFGEIPEKTIRNVRKVIGNINRLLKQNKIQKKKNFFKLRTKVKIYLNEKESILDRIQGEIELLNLARKNLKKYRDYIIGLEEEFVKYIEKNDIVDEQSKKNKNKNKNINEQTLTTRMLGIPPQRNIYKYLPTELEQSGVVTKFAFDNSQKENMFFLITIYPEDEFQIGLYNSEIQVPIYEKDITMKKLLQKKEKSKLDLHLGESLHMNILPLMVLLSEIE
ncbi:gtpase-activating protein [Anaeramoeba flamelloides]|uniref:Gtpase-activating protein n=1 Tax=Anaeramoeba flamelloides TaxID=1746091 RepID=A0ABQ8XFW4_9EUKA|nr:gtpase-activating protein [Anaeramoeba flamelloides]